MRIRLNEEVLVKISVYGAVSQPSHRGYVVDSLGKGHIIPGIGGITYNLRLGDPAFGWAGDHVEPEVSLYNPNKADSEALNILACIGNEARVASGDAKGETGYVIGKHSGAEHVMVHFSNPACLDKMNVGDGVLIKAQGQGAKIEGFESVMLNSIDPGLLQRMVAINADGKLEAPIAAEVPAALMGSGIGMDSYRGDYDIMTQDEAQVARYRLGGLRLGDMVLLRDCWNVYGRGVRKGAVSIGVVIHSDCVVGGHGPGIVNVMSAKEGLITGRFDAKCNIMDYM